MTNKTWIGNTTDYANGLNWNPNGQPNIGDTAVFSSSGMNKTVDVTFTSGFSTTLNEWLFNGSAYTVNVSTSVALQGAGIQAISGGSGLIKLGSSGVLTFQNASSAGSGTIETLAGTNGSIFFQGHSDGGTARLIIGDSTGTIDFSGSVGPNGDNKIAAGSIEGVGNVNIGPNQLLTVGSNNLSTIFSGNILAGGHSSLTKVGSGTLTLSGFDEYAGGTLTLQGGTVDLGSATADSFAFTAFGAAAHGTLRIESAALPGGLFAPIILGFAFGDSVDLPCLPFVPGATATPGAPHTLSVSNGSSTVTFDDLETSGPGNRFAAITDGAGGTDVVLAIIATKKHELVDAMHHPPGQPSPTRGPEVIIALGAYETIKGLGGNDSLVGGAVGDQLYGGRGADHFIFESLTSPSRHPDTIVDFSHAQHDKIDLSGLRALVPGDVPLVFIHAQSFAHYHHTHPSVFGMVRYSQGLVEVNVNHHLTNEFEIVMHGAPALHASDFVL